MIMSTMKNIHVGSVIGKFSDRIFIYPLSALDFLQFLQIYRYSSISANLSDSISSPSVIDETSFSPLSLEQYLNVALFSPL